MLTEFQMSKSNFKKNFYMRKFYNIIKKKSFQIIIVSIISFIAIISCFYNSQMQNIDSRNMLVINKIVFSSMIIGILIGFFLALFGEVWYRKKVLQSSNRETAKSYARIFKADMERTSRLFKNKRFQLIKIKNITIIKNWLEGFGYIAAEFNKDEIEQFINYYSRINKLIEYEDKINNHLDSMQTTTLKDYSYMKEYNGLIEVFTFEINNLFKVDIGKLKEKLNVICN